MRKYLLIIVILISIPHLVFSELIRTGLNKNLYFFDMNEKKVSEKIFIGSRFKWHNDYLWVSYLDDEGNLIGNFIDKKCNFLYEEPFMEYLDEDMGTVPEFYQKLAIMRNLDGNLVVADEQGVIGRALSRSGLAYKRINGRFVIQDKSRSYLGSFSGDEIKGLFDFGAIVKDGNLTGIKSFDDNWILPPRYDHIFASYGLVFASKDELYTVFNKKGEVVEKSIEKVLSPHRTDGEVKLFKKNGKWGVFDMNRHKYISKTDFGRVSYFSKQSLVHRKESKEFLVDYAGHELISPQDRIRRMHNGYLMIRKDGMYGVINDIGETIVPSVFTEIEMAGKNFYYLYINNLVGLFDSIKGRMVLEPKFEKISTNPYGGNRFAIVSDGRRLGVADLDSGELLRPVLYKSVEFWGPDCYILEKNDILSLVHVDGHVLIPFEKGVTFISKFKDLVNGHGPIISSGKQGLISDKGHVILECEYDEVGSFSEDVINVSKDQKWGLIDSFGRWLIPPKYQSLSPMKNDHTVAEFEGKKGLIHKSGKIIIPFKYMNMGYLNQKMVPVSLEENNRIFWGIYHLDLGHVLPVKFDSIEWIDLVGDKMQYHGDVHWKMY